MTLRRFAAALAIAAFCATTAHADTTTPRLGLTVPSINSSGYAPKINADFSILDSSVAVLASSNTFLSTNTFSGSVVLGYSSPGLCVVTDANKQLVTAQCSAVSGSSSTQIQVFLDNVQISSPTNVFKFNGAVFKASLTAGATAQVDLLPTTTYFIQNTGSPQTAAFNVSTGTVANLSATVLTASSATISSATLSGYRLTFSSANITSGIAVGTTTLNGQPVRVIDNGNGTFSFESSTTTTLNFNLKNNTSGSSPNVVLSILGAVGDAATGGASGDAVLRAANNLYLIAGGGASSRGIQIAPAGVSHLYFADGSTQTTASGGGNPFVAANGVLFGSPANAIATDTNTVTYSTATSNLMLGSFRTGTEPTNALLTLIGTGVMNLGYDSNSPTAPIFVRFFGYGGGTVGFWGWRPYNGFNFLTGQNDVGGFFVSSGTAATAEIAKINADPITGAGQFFVGQRPFYSSATMNVAGTLLVGTDYIGGNPTRSPQANGAIFEGGVDIGTNVATGYGLNVDHGQAHLNDTLIINQLANRNGETITSTGTGNAIAIVENGLPSGGWQNTNGGAINIQLNSIAEGIVMVSSITDPQNGSSMMAWYQNAPDYNDPLFWVHDVSTNSHPQMRWDAGAPNFEWVCTTTDTAHGKGKFEIAIAQFGYQFQLNNRAQDNSTFETFAKWMPLSLVGNRNEGLELEPAVTGVNGNLGPSMTYPIVWATTDTAHLVGIKGPDSVASGSWNVTIPSTSVSWGMLFQAGNDANGNRLWAVTQAGTQNQVMTSNGNANPSFQNHPLSKTKAQIQAYTPDYVGEIFYCSDCATDGVVVSTGAAVGAFGRISARTTTIN